jgi:hypothetical protein
MSQPNQFTKAEEEGKEKPAGANQFTTGKRSKHDDATRDRMRAEHLARRLYAFAAKEKDEETGELVEMDATRIAAAKILIDKGKPNLQAVEQTQVNDWDNMSEDEMVAMVNALITSNPGLIQKLGIGLRPVDPAPNAVNTVSEEQQKAG